MIGSSTYIIKQDGKFSAHIGGTFFDYMLVSACKKKRCGVFDLLVGAINGNPSARLKKHRGWGKPDADNIADEEVLRIADANNFSDSDAPGCHKLAGDRVLLVDMDDKKVFGRHRAHMDKPQEWVEITVETCNEQLHPKNTDPVMQEETSAALKVLHKQYTAACKKSEASKYGTPEWYNAREQCERINHSISALYGWLHDYHWIWGSGNSMCGTSSKSTTLTDDDRKRIPANAQGPFNSYAAGRRILDKKEAEKL